MPRRLFFRETSLSNLTPATGKVIGFTTGSEQFSVVGSTGRVPIVGTSSSTNITFDTQRVYGSATNPITEAELTSDLTGAQMGVVQKIYARRPNAGLSTPALAVPNNWVKIGFGIFIGTNNANPNTLNILYAEWVGGNRVEYWVARES
jgi:hypothetical protein